MHISQLVEQSLHEITSPKSILKIGEAQRNPTTNPETSMQHSPPHKPNP
jgi:hypothetical protein